MTDWKPYPDNKPKVGHYQIKLRARVDAFFLTYGYFNGYLFEGESGWPIPDTDVIAFREWNEDYEEKIKAIAYTYGRDRQTVKAREEFAEASAAAARLAFARNTEKDGGKYMNITPLENDLASECADVLVLIQQLRVLIPGFAGRVDLAMHEKIDRQIDRIAKEESHA